MILDGALQFDSAASLAQPVGTYNSTNVIDIGIVGGLPASAAGAGGARDLGIGDDPALKLLVQVVTTFTSGGAPTLQVVLQGAPDAGGNAPGAWTSWWTSPAYTLGQLIQGARLYDMDMPRPPLDQPVPRFLRLNYIIASATVTAGAVTSYILGDRMDQVEQANAVMGGYPAGITVAN
jgi:hypothetical protein